MESYSCTKKDTLTSTFQKTSLKLNYTSYICKKKSAAAKATLWLLESVFHSKIHNENTEIFDVF